MRESEKMRKMLFLIGALLSISAFAEQTVELGSTSIKGNRKADYTLTPKEYKNTFTISQEKIRERNYKNVEDALRDAPGVTIQHTAFGPRVDMRGSGEKSLQRVKVIVDGVSINPTEETMASLPINAIPIETVKKIEIIPGGGATLYGSGSVGGVVSITTNSNATKNNFFMDLNYGSYDNRNFGFAGGYNVTDKLYLNYGFNYLNSEGYRREEEKENKIFLGGFDYKFNEKNRFRLQVRHSDMKDDGSTQLSKKQLEEDRRNTGLNMDLDTQDRSYTVDYEYRPTKNVTLVATGYRQEQERDIKAESIDDIKIEEDTTVELKRYKYYFYNTHSLLDAKFKENKDGVKLKGKFEYSFGETILGYDYQKSRNQRNSYTRSNTLITYNDGESDGNILPGHEQKPVSNKAYIDLKKISHAFYIFNKWKANKKWDITTGLRTELTSYKGLRRNGPNQAPYAEPEIKESETSRSLKNFAGEVGFLYKYRDTGRVFLRYERGFVTPFANQLTDKIHDTDLKSSKSTAGLMEPPVMNTAFKYVDNHLKSEETNTVELGFRDYWFGSLISTSFFLTDTKDEITLISSGVTNPAVNTWKYRNIGKTRRMGIELEAEQNYGKWTLNESLTFLDTKVLKANEEARLSKGDRVPLVPRIKATLGLKYKLSSKLSLIGTYTYFSNREKREMDDKDNVYKHTIDGHGVMDLGVLYAADAYSNVKVGAKNILNKKYNLLETKSEAFPAPERNYYLELNVRF